MKFSDDPFWCKLERIKKQLRDRSKTELANKLYKAQLRYEDKLTKDFICQNSKNLKGDLTSLKSSVVN